MRFDPRTWQLVAARGKESCRWVSDDGRWLTVTLEDESELSKVVVADSTGQRETVGSYESALALAKSWRG